MSKKSTSNNVYAILGILAILLAGAGFGFFAAPAVSGTVHAYDTAAIYDFVFGNNALAALNSNGLFVTAFVVLIIASAFQLLAVLFSFGTSKKFAGFLHIVAGILAAISAIVSFLSAGACPLEVAGETWVLAWGGIISGAVCAASAVVSLGLGVKGFLAK